MANEVVKGKLFIKQVLGKLKGDDNEVLAAKISRKAVSAIEGQLASLNSKKVDLENTLEDAQEGLTNATYPTSVFSDNSNYCQQILHAQQRVDQAQENLEATEKAYEYFSKLLASF